MDLIIPVTYAEVNGEHWSWCESKMNRLLYKKGIADAAVDGVVPEGKLRTPAQAYQDTMGWLERLDAGELQVIARPQINVPLPDRTRLTYSDASVFAVDAAGNESPPVDCLVPPPPIG